MTNEYVHRFNVSELKLLPLIVFQTNLDNFFLPEYEFNFLPPIGSKILCRSNGREVYLEVYSYSLDRGIWRVELSIPKALGMSLKEFYKVYVGVDL
jgi:hypothetical protein